MSINQKGEKISTGTQLLYVYVCVLYTLHYIFLYTDIKNTRRGIFKNILSSAGTTTQQRVVSVCFSCALFNLIS